MAINLYTKDGWLDFDKIASITKHTHFTFITGARGVGKTFSCSKYIINHCIEHGETFLYLRRKKTQYEISSKPESNPFTALIIRDAIPDVTVRSISKDLSGIYLTAPNEEGEPVAVGAPIGYMSSLATFANLRGMAFNVSYIIYDEFIPETHEPIMKGEAQAFFQMYETINRNNAIEGKDEVRVYCLANSNDIANPIFTELKVVKKCEQMMAKGKQISLDPDRDLCLIHLSGSPISVRKRNTALYKLTAGCSEEFNAMALENRYYMDESAIIKSCKLTEYIPMVSMNGITIYKHKSDHKYYVTTHKSGDCKTYGSSAAEKKRFIVNHRYLWNSYLMNNIYFEEYICMILFEQCFDTKR